jgi:hypothetical protein
MGQQEYSFKHKEFLPLLGTEPTIQPKGKDSTD